MQIIKVLALLALASGVTADGPLTNAPLLRCLSTYTYGNSLAVEISLVNTQPECGARRFQSFTIDVRSAQGPVCYTQMFPDQNKMVQSVWFGPNAGVAEAILHPWSCPLGTCNASPLPCGTAFTITVTNEDKQSSSITCSTQACPVTVASPPPVVYSPPPVVCSPPPVVYSPPPCVASPPPPVAVASPPPCVASPPPVVYSPPPCVASPPPVAVSSPPPCVASPPPCVASPPPVAVSSPPPAWCSPVKVSSPPPAWCSPVKVSSPPPAYCKPVYVAKPPAYCKPVKRSSPPPAYCAPIKAPKPSCGVNHWGKPVYCKGKKKCCTVTVNKWYGKRCVKTTKKECLNKCPGHKWW